MGLFKRSLSWVVLLSWLQAFRGGGGFLLRNARLEKCLHASSHEAERIGLADCKPHSPSYQWRWDGPARALVNQKTRECLAVPAAQEFALAQLETCGEDRARQAWACGRKGHLTLQGFGLHLSAKPGGHRAFLARQKGKFSRWKAAGEDLVCVAEHPAGAPGSSGPPRAESLDALAGLPESKTITWPAIHTLSADTPTTPSSATWEDSASTTGAFPTNEGTNWEDDQERFILHERKDGGSQHSGTSWATVMLVLSPLAFVLGVVILLLNIHHNKKKKMLSALKSRQVVLEECRPLPEPPSPSLKRQQAPPSPSPSPRRGEILIEWKDGTITPLFDSMNYPIC